MRSAPEGVRGVGQGLVPCRTIARQRTRRCPTSLVRLAITGVLILASLAHATPTYADPISDLQKRYQASLAQAQQALSGFSVRRQEQQQTVETLRGVTNIYAADLRKVDQELFVTVNALQQAEENLAALQADIRRLEGEIVEKQAAVDQRAAAYGTRLRGLYKFTRTSPLEQLLAARDFSDALHRITMMQAVARVDNRLLGQLRDEQTALVAAKTALQEKQAAAAAVRDEIDQKRQVLVDQRAQQSTLVAKAQAEQRQSEAVLTEFDRQQREQAAEIVTLQGQYQAQLAELERQRQEEIRRQEELRRLEEERRAQATATAIAQATAAAARLQPTATLRPGQPSPTPGRPAGTPVPLPSIAPLPGSVQTASLQPSSFGLIWPVTNPVVTTEYGEATFAESFHRGIDLARDQYTPVFAAADGIVLQSGLAVPGKPSQSYGMRVVIGHSPTLSTLYAHLDDTKMRPLVKEGDRVKRGQIIGYIGLTGITSGPHLHFEVQVSGEQKNPRNYLPR